MPLLSSGRVQIELRCDLLLGTNQIAHRLHIRRVTGEPEAIEVPPVLDRGEHGVVVVSDVRNAGGMVGMRNGQHDGTAAALTSRRVAAARVVAKPLKP